MKETGIRWKEVKFGRRGGSKKKRQEGRAEISDKRRKRGVKSRKNDGKLTASGERN